MSLRPYDDSDLALTEALEMDQRVMLHLGGVSDAAGARAVHEKRMAGIAAGDLYRVVVPDGATEPVGLVAVWREEFEGAEIHEFGIMFRPEHHRRGLGMVASREIIAEFRASGVADRLHSFTTVGNVAAATAAPILGFRLIGECDLDYEGKPLRCHHWVMDF
jgi:RimJ/RimL family protein N-acetyltransferase